MEGFFKIAFSNNFDYKAAQKYVAEEIQNRTLYISAAYVIGIFSVRVAMTNFKPFQAKTWWYADRNDYMFQLTKAMVIWNAALAIFSVCGAYATTQSAFDEVSKKGLVGSYTQHGQFYHGKSGYWAFMLMMSKIVEFGDTFFLVFRKKPLIFLHWYHHLLTFNYGIWAYGEDMPFNMYISWMNYVVHSVMYSYYCLRSFRFRITAVVARFITLLQILQFVVMLAIIIHLGILKLMGYTVAFAPFTYFLCLAMEISYLLLFMNFFYQSYIKGGGAKFIAEKRVKVTDKKTQ